MGDANKQIVRRLFEELPKGNFAALDELIADDVVAHDPAAPGPVHGRAAYRGLMEQYLSAFSDLEVRIEDQFGEDDKVVTRSTITARHTGELLGVPATGNRVEISSVDIHRLDEGRIVEEWASWDALGLMRQLGVAPETVA